MIIIFLHYNARKNQAPTQPEMQLRSDNEGSGINHLGTDTERDSVYQGEESDSLLLNGHYRAGRRIPDKESLFRLTRAPPLPSSSPLPLPIPSPYPSILPLTLSHGLISPPPPPRTLILPLPLRLFLNYYN